MLKFKRGVAGDLIMLIVVTAIIVAILLIFVLGSNFIKKIDNVRGGVSVLDETAVGIGDIIFYGDEFKKHVEIRVKLLEEENGR